MVREQDNWGMTAAHTLSCCVIHIHLDAHTHTYNRYV